MPDALPVAVALAFKETLLANAVADIQNSGMTASIRRSVWRSATQLCDVVLLVHGSQEQHGKRSNRTTGHDVRTTSVTSLGDRWVTVHIALPET